MRIRKRIEKTVKNGRFPWTLFLFFFVEIIMIFPFFFSRIIFLLYSFSLCYGCIWSRGLDCDPHNVPLSGIESYSWYPIYCIFCFLTLSFPILDLKEPEGVLHTKERIFAADLSWYEQEWKEKAKFVKTKTRHWRSIDFIANSCLLSCRKSMYCVMSPVRESKERHLSSMPFLHLELSPSSFYYDFYTGLVYVLLLSFACTIVAAVRYFLGYNTISLYYYTYLIVVCSIFFLHHPHHRSSSFSSAWQAVWTIIDPFLNIPPFCLFISYFHSFYLSAFFPFPSPLSPSNWPTYALLFSSSPLGVDGFGYLSFIHHSKSYSSCIFFSSFSTSSSSIHSISLLRSTWSSCLFSLPTWAPCYCSPISAIHKLKRESPVLLSMLSFRRLLNSILAPIPFNIPFYLALSYIKPLYYKFVVGKVLFGLTYKMTFFSLIS